MFEENCKENVLNLIFEEKDEGWKQKLYLHGYLILIDGDIHFQFARKMLIVKGKFTF